MTGVKYQITNNKQTRESRRMRSASAQLCTPLLPTAMSLKLLELARYGKPMFKNKLSDLIVFTHFRSLDLVEQYVSQNHA